jgi:hypothetical protein
MTYQIELPQGLFAEWWAEALDKSPSSPNLFRSPAGYLAHKAAEWAADQQLLRINNWIRCLSSHPKTGIRCELDILQLDRLARELYQAMRPKPPSLKEQAASELVLLREEMKRHGLEVPATPALTNAITSLPEE